jgi:hypothetical protein
MHHFFPNGGFVSTIENRSPGSLARLSAPLLIGHGSPRQPKQVSMLH